MPRIAAKKLLIWTAESIAGLITALAAAFLLGFWAFSQGWVSPKTITPFVEDMIGEILPGFDADIHEIEAVWFAHREFVLIRLRDVVLTPKSGGQPSKVSRVDVSFSTAALLTARLAPSGLTISGGEFNWHDRPLAARRQRPDLRGVNVVLGGMGRFLTSPISGTTAALSYLHKVDVSKVQFRQIGSDGRVKWESRDIAFSFSRPYLAQEARFRADATVKIGADVQPLKITGDISPDQGLVRVEIKSNQFPVRIFEPVAPELKRIVNLDMNVQGRFRLLLTPEGDLHSARGQMESPQGFINAPLFLISSRNIQKIFLDVYLDFNKHILELREFSFENANQKNNRVKLKGELDFASLNAKLANGSLAESEVISHITAKMDFTDMEFVYIKTMKPIRNARGHCVLQTGQLRCDVKKGKIIFADGSLALKNGLFTISDIAQPTSRAMVDFEASGAPNIFGLWLDSMPNSRYKTDYFLNAAYQGEGVIKADISWPAYRSQTGGAKKQDRDVFLNIEININDLKTFVHLSDLRMPMHDGNVSISMTEKAYAINGHGRIGGAVVHVNYRRSFKSGGAQGRALQSDDELNLDIIINDDLLRALGLDAVLKMEGQANLTAVLSNKKSGNFYTGHAQMDLTSSALHQPLLSWQKKKGEASALRFDIVSGAQGWMLNSIAITGDSMTARGAMAFNRAGNLISAKFATIKMRKERGKNSIRLDAARRKDGVLSADLRIASLDMRPALELLDGAGEISAAAPEEAGKERFFVKARIGRMIGHHGADLRSVAANIYREGEQISAFEMRGRLHSRGKNSPVRVLMIKEKGKRRLSLKSEDAGAVLRGLDLYQNINGGALSLTAQLPDRNHNLSVANQKITGKIQVNKFYVSDAPVFGQILGAASFDGLTGVLSGQGVFFNKMELSFTRTPEQIMLHEGWAVGTALGISLQGNYQRRSPYKISMSGTLTPAYIVNSFLSTIPGLGTVLTNRKGEGVFGISFTLGGTSAAPDVSVNPLSVVTPGILRRIFEFGGGETELPESKPAKAK